MDQSKIIDLIVFQEQHKNRQSSLSADELSIAIQSLIKRLRESNPIKEVS